MYYYVVHLSTIDRRKSMSINRRVHFRIPDNRFITEFYHSTPFVSVMTNLSAEGLFTVKPIQKKEHYKGEIQLEIPIPRFNATILATGEIMFRKFGQNSVGQGIKFKNMAKAHRNLLKDIITFPVAHFG